MTVRLAYLVSHPIQYQAPLLRRITQEPDIDLTVFFRSDFSLKEHTDPGFGTRLKWDIPLVDGYKHEFLPVVYGKDRFTMITPLHTGITERLRRGKFDALWVHGYTGLTNWWAMLQANRLGIDVLVRDDVTLSCKRRGTFNRWAKSALFAWLRRSCNGFLAVGTRNREYYRSYGIQDGRNWLMPYAVDNDFFRSRSAEAARARERLRAELGLQPGRPVILYASKLQARKRAADLLRAYIRLSKTGTEPDPYLIIVGDGECRRSLEAEAAATGWQSISFLGFQNQTELPRFYDLCDVFVLPSVEEPFGLIVNEVMSAGRPVIVSDQVGCAPDLVREGENGYVYPAGNTTALSKCLQEIVSDPTRARRMGEVSLQIIADWDFEHDIRVLRRALGLPDRRPDISE